MRIEMRTGNITQTAWNRFVRGQLHIEEKEGVVFPPAPEENCSGFRAAGQDGAFVWSTASVTGDSPRTVFYAAFQAAGNLASRGILARGISFHILLPVQASEALLSETAEAAQDVCRMLGTEAACFQAEVNPAVQRIVAAADAAGEGFCGEHAGTMQPGQEIVLCGYAGLEGMLRILDEAGDELAERFSSSFLAQAQRLKRELVLPEQIVAACRGRTEEGEPVVSAVRQIGSGGILAALWEMAEIYGAGLEVSMGEIALKQETVEICEHYQLNPYQMTSSGSYLIATGHAEELMRILEKTGARAGRLGIAKAQNARVITGGDEIRYLDRPALDSLAHWWEKRPFQYGRHAGV